MPTHMAWNRRSFNTGEEHLSVPHTKFLPPPAYKQNQKQRFQQPANENVLDYRYKPEQSKSPNFVSSQYISQPTTSNSAKTIIIPDPRHKPEILKVPQYQVKKYEPEPLSPIQTPPPPQYHNNFSQKQINDSSRNNTQNRPQFPPSNQISRQYQRTPHAETQYLKPSIPMHVQNNNNNVSKFEISSPPPRPEAPNYEDGFGGCAVLNKKKMKMANLSNAAVSRMISEQKKEGKIKEVIWPPPENGIMYASDLENLNGNCYTQDSQYQNGDENNQFYSHPPGCRPSTPKNFEPPPTTITLRSEAPVSQEQAPCIVSQPATSTFRGGYRRRGDLKWPPAQYRSESVEENELTAKGSAVRPKKVKKDYMPFFAQNALPNTYPGYRAPPGTQHYYEENANGYGSDGF